MYRYSHIDVKGCLWIGNLFQPLIILFMNLLWFGIGSIFSILNLQNKFFFFFNERMLRKFFETILNNIMFLGGELNWNLSYVEGLLFSKILTIGFRILTCLLDAAMTKLHTSIRGKLLWMRRSGMSHCVTAGWFMLVGHIYVFVNLFFFHL